MLRIVMVNSYGCEIKMVQDLCGSPGFSMDHYCLLVIAVELS
jgi:hypothetical protein